MAKVIVWSRLANNSFLHIVNYLENEWSYNVAIAFADRCYKVIELLSEYPELGSIEEPERKIRGFVVTKHNTLFTGLTIAR